MSLPVAVAKHLEHKTSLLRFGLDDPRNGEYYVRGSIAWPALVEEQGQDTAVIGHCLVMGWNVDTRKISIFDEMAFPCVDHILGAEREIRYSGVASFLNKAWALFYCDSYYYHEPHTVHEPFAWQVGRSEMINPKPHFVEVEWTEDANAEAVMWRIIQARQIVIPKEISIVAAIQQHQVRRLAWPASVKALVVGCNGFERFPYRFRKAAV